MFSTILSQVGLPLLIEFVTQGLKSLSHPAAKAASEALEKVEEAIASGGINSDEVVEANRHAEEMARIRLKEYETSLAQINTSIRDEVNSQDKYVRRMRPTFGYLMALTWALQMGALSYVILFDPARAAGIMNAFASLSTIWAVGLSVLGVYVYKRSEDKKLTNLTKDILPQIAFKKDIEREALPPVKPDFQVNE